MSPELPPMPKGKACHFHIDQHGNGLTKEQAIEYATQATDQLRQQLDGVKKENERLTASLKMADWTATRFYQKWRLHGDLLDACAPYLKEGETPAQRIERDIGDMQALMGLLAKDRQRIAELEGEVGFYRTEGRVLASTTSTRIAELEAQIAAPQPAAPQAVQLQTQNPMPEEFQKVLEENLWDLYADGSAAPQAVQGDQAPFAYVNLSAFTWQFKQSEKIVKLTRSAQPEHGFTVPLYTSPPERKEKP